jgi:N utilization substance protein B
MGSRSVARQQVMQVLYLQEQSELDANEAVAFFAENFELHDAEMPMIRTYVQGVETHLDKLDDVISEHSKRWKMYRMPRIDRSILRLGAYELLFVQDVPVSVVINEAIELAKKYGEQNTPKFINGILDSIAKKNRPAEH